MSTFKLKPEKARYVSDFQTVDGTHQKLYSGFKSNEASLPKKKNKLKQLESKLKKLERPKAP